jgi:hypothetical protein
MFPFIGSIIVVAAYDNKDFVGSNFGTTIAAFLMYGFSVAPFTYMISFAFQSHSTAQVTRSLTHSLAFAVTNLFFIFFLPVSWRLFVVVIYCVLLLRRF